MPNGARTITREMLKKYCLAGGWIEAELKPNAARAKISGMLNTLAGKHIIGLTADFLWLAQAAQASAGTSPFSPGPQAQAAQAPPYKGVPAPARP